MAPANDGRAAIAASGRPPQQCGIVITDLQLPGADGFEVLTRRASEESGAVSVNRAPIVINPKTTMGQQVLPHDCLYPLRDVVHLEEIYDQICEANQSALVKPDELASVAERLKKAR